MLSTRSGRPTDVQSLSVAGTPVSIADDVKNLGTVFDSTFNMEKHVNATCKAAFFHLRKIARIRNYLDKSATERVVHSFVTSRIDYCNSLLYGASCSLLAKLQRVQNTAARIVSGSRKYDHITPVLHDLHWLPIQTRIEYKVLLLVFKCLHGLAPVYLSDLLQPYCPSRPLRSREQQLLSIPRTRLKTYGDRAFTSFAPKLWNALPLNIKKCQSLTVFKTKLKSYLFYKCFM